MSIADHFDHAPDASFVRDYDSATARRQFRVSLVLMVAIAVAITALGLLIRFDGPSQGAAAFGDSVQSPPSYAGKL